MNPDLFLVESEGGLDLPQFPFQVVALEEQLISNDRVTPDTTSPTRSRSALLISHNRSAIAMLCIIALLIGRLFWKALLSKSPMAINLFRTRSSLVKLESSLVCKKWYKLKPYDQIWSS